MASQSRKDKQKFFANLYALDDLAGEDEAMPLTAEYDSRRPGDEARRSSRSGNRRVARSACSDGAWLDSEVRRSQDEDSVDRHAAVKKRGRGYGRSSDRISPPSRRVSSRPAFGVTSNPPMHASESTPGLTQTQTEDATPKASKRARKKGPELPQIFAGQTFIFVPNDDRAVPRKRRIDKAILHGAIWAKAWVPSVTHIIVESERKLKDVVKLTGQEDLPANIALVWDTWLTESLGYKEMRDSTARRFQVTEHQPMVRSEPAMELQKDSFDEHAKASNIREEFKLGGSQKRPRDALDDLYEEAKATQHLVGRLVNEEIPYCADT